MPAGDGVPEGQLFSRVYLERGKPAQDSDKFRRRFANFVAALNSGLNESIAIRLSFEVGTSPSQRGYRVWDWLRYFTGLNLSDFLDSITVVIATSMAANADNGRLILAFVERALREENVGYRVDASGGVHFYIDEEFERSRAATIDLLEGSGNEATRLAIEEAHAALRGDDRLLAVRRAFDAVENRFKIDFGVSRLGAAEIKSKLTPVVASRYSGRVEDAAKRMLAAFAEWTNASHQFRHAPGSPDPAAPPIDIAVLMVGEAMGYLRWLSSLKAGANVDQ